VDEETEFMYECVSRIVFDILKPIQNLLFCRNAYNILKTNAVSTSTFVGSFIILTSYLALFPFYSFLNHSCQPNCILITKGSCGQVVACEDIPVGSELTVIKAGSINCR
jgi:hypothetical protein